MSIFSIHKIADNNGVNNWYIHGSIPTTEYRGNFFLYEPFFNPSSNRYDFYYLPPLTARDDIITITSISGAFTFAQKGKALVAGSIINNTRDGSSNHITVTYDSRADTADSAVGIIEYTATNSGSTSQGTLTFVVRREFTPDTPDADNVVDHGEQIIPEQISTGAGIDTITTGKLNDIIIAGKDDDMIDLSSDIGDKDAVIYQFKEAGNNFVAFDGGDKITGFIPGQDTLQFHNPSSTGDTITVEETSVLPTSAGGVIGEAYVVVPILEKLPRDELFFTYGWTDKAIWANYIITGLEFHFPAAIVLPTGWLTGTILTIIFDQDHVIRGDIFLSKSGDSFDDFSLQLKNFDIVLNLLDDDFTSRPSSLDDAPKANALEVMIYENHPTNKPAYTPMIKAEWDAIAGGTWSLPETAGVLSDESLFEIRDGGKLWWRDYPDYEDAQDGWGNNRYQLKLRYTEPDAIDGTPGQQFDQWLDIIVQDISFERPAGVNGLYENIDYFIFTPLDIDTAYLPSDFVQYLISGRAWKMPATGPLTITWSLATDAYESQSQLEETNQGIIDQFRGNMQRAFDSFEAAANLRFIEVAITDDTAGDFLITYGSEFLIGTTGFNLGFARLPSNDPIIVIREIPETARTDDIPWRYSAILHEIGHALGLKHPFEDDFNTAWPLPDDPNEFKRSTETIMSYANPTARDQELYQADIDAMQFLYGAPGTDFDGVESLINTIM